MDAAPYYAPTYFPASYFYSATTTPPASGSTGLQPYNAPAYFAPSYFYGPSSTSADPSGLQPYNAPTYFAPSYFYGPSSASADPSGLQPYNTPAYFAPSYFYGPSSASADPSGLQPYNAPTYFAPSYFYGPSSVVVVGPPPPPVVGNQDPYRALIASLNSTGAFEEVIFGAAAQRSQAGADTYPLAVLTPQGWEEADDVDPVSIVRRTTFSISIVVTSQDGLPRFEQLDQLSTAVKAAIDGSNLDGTCLPALTRIRSGHYVYVNHYPEQCLELEGEFSMIIDPASLAWASS